MIVRPLKIIKDLEVLNVNIYDITGISSEGNSYDIDDR